MAATGPVKVAQVVAATAPAMSAAVMIVAMSAAENAVMISVERIEASAERTAATTEIMTVATITAMTDVEIEITIAVEGAMIVAAAVKTTAMATVVAVIVMSVVVMAATGTTRARRIRSVPATARSVLTAA